MSFPRVDVKTKLDLVVKRIEKIIIMLKNGYRLNPFLEAFALPSYGDFLVYYLRAIWSLLEKTKNHALFTHKQLKF